MDLQLADKIAIVTGSSRGLGLASARALLDEGCRVTICARGEARLDRDADRAQSQGADCQPGADRNTSEAAGTRRIAHAGIGAKAGGEQPMNGVIKN